MTTKHRPAGAVVELHRRQRDLGMSWSDGYLSAFHYIWLRDNCPCSECRHSSGQRILDTTSIPRSISPKFVSLAENGGVDIVWAHDNHSSRYAAEWLRGHSYSEKGGENQRRQPKLWDAETLRPLPEGSYTNVAAAGASLRTWLTLVSDYGFAILRGVPCVSGIVTDVAELFGYVRETNFGRYFDVRTMIDPNNVAYTSLPLSAHTDNPYRDPVPTLQLLHCLSSDDMGGETTVVDGFCVAEALRVREPEKFQLLTTVPVGFQFHDKDCYLEAESTLIQLSPQGQVVGVKFNNASDAPFSVDYDLMEPFYDAYQTFALMLYSPEFEVRVKLDPGDLYIVDNTRVLHGRTRFSGGGKRHFQGCYADMDALLSRLRVLSIDGETPNYGEQGVAA